MDNFELVCGTDPGVANRKFDLLLAVLTFLGVPFHEVVRPCTRFIHLGYGVDTRKWVVFVPTQRAQWMTSYLVPWASTRFCSLAELESVTGVLMFLAAIFTFIKPSTKVCYALIASTKKRIAQGRKSALVRFTPQLRATALFSEYVVRTLNGEWSINNIFPTAVTCIIFGDAGLTVSDIDPSVVWGRGAYSKTSREFFALTWPRWVLNLAYRNSKFSSTYVEVFTMVSAVATFAPDGARVELNTDSQPAYHCFQRNFSKCPLICELLHALYYHCMQHNIVIVRVVWVRRHLNTASDLLSHGRIQEFHVAMAGEVYTEVPVIDLRPLRLQPARRA